MTSRNEIQKLNIEAYMDLMDLRLTNFHIRLDQDCYYSF